ncbi:MAG: T9SS type A sorting domain-containing protein [Bacteroidales bacterium]|nr:T9SS type A sorting domain-containing protein [Bacteroidales bacterium]MCF8327570.1 T9SS type A sorting domain-containing protein [Bacteroidales bacterium]
MKKIYLFIMMIAISGYVIGQERVAGEIEKKMDASLIESMDFTTKTPTDTLVPYGIQNASGLSVARTAEGGYIAGVNGYGDLAKAQQFPVTDGYYVEGFLVWVGVKDVLGSAGTVDGVLYDMDGNTGSTTAGEGTETCPGSVLASVSLAMDTDVDTSGSSFTPVEFANPVLVSDDYAVGLDFTNIGDDTLGVVHSADGDAQQSELSWEMWSDNSWYSILYAWQGLDIDMAFLPVVDMSTQDINEHEFVNGIRMETYPNPAVEQVNLDFQIQEASNVKVSIMDMTGKIVKTEDFGQKEAGKHNVKISANDLNSGNYIYVLEADNKRLAKKMVIQ